MTILKVQCKVWDNVSTESPLKVMKSPFYFTLKVIFVLKIFRFLPGLFGHVENDLIRKIRLISKIMMLRPGWQAIVVYILPNIVSKGNLTRKFGQLLEYNMRNIFLEKSYKSSILRPFSKKAKLSIALDQ